MGGKEKSIQGSLKLSTLYTFILSDCDLEASRIWRNIVSFGLLLLLNIFSKVMQLQLCSYEMCFEMMKTVYDKVKVTHDTERPMSGC